MTAGLRRIRAEQQLTLRELAGKSGVAKETISEIERGMRTPHTLTLAKLASALGVDLDALVVEQEEVPALPKGKAPDAGPDEGVAAGRGFAEAHPEETERVGLIEALAGLFGSYADGWFVQAEEIAQKRKEPCGLGFQATAAYERLWGRVEDTGLGSHAIAVLNGEREASPKERGACALLDAEAARAYSATQTARSVEKDAHTSEAAAHGIEALEKFLDANPTAKSRA